MRFSHSFRTCTAFAFMGLRGLSPHVASAQPASTVTYDVAMPPGMNFDKAKFRLWLPGGGEGNVPGYPTAWFPTERVAKAWRTMVTEQPNEADHE